MAVESRVAGPNTASKNTARQTSRVLLLIDYNVKEWPNKVQSITTGSMVTAVGRGYASHRSSN